MCEILREVYCLLVKKRKWKETTVVRSDDGGLTSSSLTRRAMRGAWTEVCCSQQDNVFGYSYHFQNCFLHCEMNTVCLIQGSLLHGCLIAESGWGRSPSLGMRRVRVNPDSSSLEIKEKETGQTLDRSPGSGGG